MTDENRALISIAYYSDGHAWLLHYSDDAGIEEHMPFNGLARAKRYAREVYGVRRFRRSETNERYWWAEQT